MIKTLENFEVDALFLLIFIGITLMVGTFFALGFQSNTIFAILVGTAPLWLPGITFVLFFESWVHFVQKKFDLSQGRTTIEIKLPQEIFKSPEAMEFVLTYLHQTASPDNLVQTYWDGKNPPTYSLELVSRHGDVRFYMNVPKKKFKNLVETQLYAQYPGIEVKELDIDYTAEIPWDTSRFSYFSLHFGLKKADAYPIKTYLEFGLDKMPKEEEKVDPISGMLEVLGSLGPGEHAWIQILITANRKTTFKEGVLSESSDWTDAARAEIKKIIENANKRVGVRVDPEKGVSLNMMNLSDGEKETIKAIERSLGKNAFDTKIRGMYIATNESFNPGERIGGIITGWRNYDDLNRNAIGARWRTDVDWPWWEDPSGHKREHMKKEELAEYKRRTYTSYNKIDGAKVMTVEELATIFHLPGKVALTPTLARIPSKRAEAPSNLPTGS